MQVSAATQATEQDTAAVLEPQQLEAVACTQDTPAQNSNAECEATADTPDGTSDSSLQQQTGQSSAEEWRKANSQHEPAGQQAKKVRRHAADLQQKFTPAVAELLQRGCRSSCCLEAAYAICLATKLASHRECF